MNKWSNTHIQYRFLWLELLSRLRLLSRRWWWWCRCLFLCDSSSDELLEDESCLDLLCFLCLLFLSFLFFFFFFSILSNFLRSFNLSSLDMFFKDCNSESCSELVGWLTILYFCIRGSSCKSQAVHRIRIPSSFISSINLFWSIWPTGASASTALPYNSLKKKLYVLERSRVSYKKCITECLCFLLVLLSLRASKDMKFLIILDVGLVEVNNLVTTWDLKNLQKISIFPNLFLNMSNIIYLCMLSNPCYKSQ